MKIFPSRSLRLQLSVTANTAFNNLSNATWNTSAKSFFGMKPLKPFKGLLHENKFNISRALLYRNSFQANILGEIKDAGASSVVNVRFDIKPLVKAFLMIWSSIASIFLLIIIFVTIRDQNISLALGCLIPLGMLFFCHLLVRICFIYDYKRSKETLVQILEKES